MIVAQLEKLAARVKGIPDKKDYGNIEKSLTPGELVSWFVQKHKAQRAGEHYDYRFGTPESKLFSWASKKEMPEPGKPGKAWFQQPLHEHGYGSWQGNIPTGYGAGTVRKEDEGEVLINDVRPGKINFTIAHRRFPERYALSQDKNSPKKWYLINTTPRVPVEFKKQHYIKIDIEDAKKKFEKGIYMSPKIDGAAAFLNLLKDKIEVVSYRANKAGMPIVHTERMFGGLPKVDLPKEMQNQTLRGEIYGTRDLDGDGVDEVIPARELSGLLNSTLANSLKTQKKNKIQLRMVLFNVMGSKLPFSKKLRFMKDVAKKLPKQITVAQQIKDPAKMHETLKQIQSGKHPLTSEGVVLTPEEGTPYKAKFYDPYRVWVNSIFPGEKRLEGYGAGGFTYGLSPKGPDVGKVGTGFSDDMRRDMLEHPEEWLGRMALIESQGQFPSGAYRAPAFKQLHEDYAAK